MSVNPFKEDDPRFEEMNRAITDIVAASSGVAWLIENGMISLNTDSHDPEMRKAGASYASCLVALMDASNERGRLYR